MDYAEGDELWHFQWDQIQDPSRVWMKWNKDEEEGENLSLTGKFYAVLNGDKKYRLYDKSEITILAGIDVDINFLADEYIYNLQKSSLITSSITFDSINIVAAGELGIPLEWDIINQDGETMNTTLLPPGKYIIKTKISHYYRFVYNKGKLIKFKSGDLQKLSEPVTITFKLTVATQPVVRLEPYDRVNFYLDFGYDDALVEENQKAGHYLEETIAGQKYYVPWMNIKPNVKSKLKLNFLYDELFVSKIKVGIPQLTTDKSLNNQTNYNKEYSLYFLLKADNGILINGLESLYVTIES